VNDGIEDQSSGKSTFIGTNIMFVSARSTAYTTVADIVADTKTYGPSNSMFCVPGRIWEKGWSNDTITRVYNDGTNLIMMCPGGNRDVSSNLTFTDTVFPAV
jgi:hypothetical protein